MDPRDVERARLARSAYETGRAREAAKIVPIAIAMAAFGAAATGSIATAAAIGIPLAALVFLLAWRGRELGHGVVPGLVGGALPLALPVALRSAGHCCIEPMGACWIACLPACVGAGVAAGIVVGAWAARSAHERPWRTGRVAASALLVATLAGAMGCLVVGTAGLAGMALGLVAGTAPLFLITRLRGQSAV